MDRRSKNSISEDDYYSAAVVLASPALVAAAATVLVEYGEQPALRATRSIFVFFASTHHHFYKHPVPSCFDELVAHSL